MNTNLQKFSDGYVLFPESLKTDYWGFCALAKSLEGIHLLKRSECVWDFQNTYWIDAHFCSYLAAVISLLETSDVSVKIINVSDKIRQIFLRNGFLNSKFGQPTLVDTYDTTIPYRQFECTDSSIRDFIAFLKGNYFNKEALPSMSKDELIGLQEGLLEIFSNSRDHSAAGAGVHICGQHYPSEYRSSLYLSITDTGIGIPDSVSSFLGEEIVDTECIRWAITNGNTTKEDTNSGLGLNIVREYVKRHSGSIYIASGKALWFEVNGKDYAYMLESNVVGTTIILTVKTK